MLSTLSRLFDKAFWKATATALLRTFIAGVVPFVMMYLNHQTVDLKYAVSQVSLLVVVAIFTSLKGIPNPANATPMEILIFRFLRQLFQYGSAALATAVLITDVSWGTVISGMVISAFSTILLGSVSITPGEGTATPGQVVVNNYTADTLPVEAEIEDAEVEADPGVVITDEEPDADEELRASEEEALDEPAGARFA